jgi:hypothetical protein
MKLRCQSEKGDADRHLYRPYCSVIEQVTGDEELAGVSMFPYTDGAVSLEQIKLTTTCWDFAVLDMYIDERPIPVKTVCKTYFERSSALPSSEFPLQPTRDATIMLSDRFQRNPFFDRVLE